MVLMAFFVLMIGVFGALVMLMKKIQFHQPIFELSPATHQAKKNIPTMGGIGILLGIWIILGLMKFADPRLIWLTVLATGFGLIGILDDGLSVFKAKNKGLSVIEKLGLQGIVAVGMVGAFHVWITPISVGLALVYIVMIVGGTNATNLTDGLDGLLAGLSVISAIGFLVVFQSDLVISQWLLFWVMGLLAYGAFNGYPARIFMGDTGSLQMGAILTGLAMIDGNIWVLLPLGAVYIVETLSVIIQVAGYKLTHKRFFLMAPLHHHFELLGLKETQVVGLFWVVGTLFGVLGFI